MDGKQIHSDYKQLKENVAAPLLAIRQREPRTPGWLQSVRGPDPRHNRLARRLGIFDHSGVLAGDPPPRERVAVTATLALSRACPHVGRHVDRDGRHHLALASPAVLFVTDRVDPRRSFLRLGLEPVQNRRTQFFRSTTRWTPRA